MSENDEIKCCYCGKNVYLGIDNKSSDGFFQCLYCKKIPTLELYGKVVSIQEIYDVNRNRDKIHEWLIIDQELSMVNVENQFEEKILYGILANREVGTGFMGYNKAYEAVLLANENEFLGCIVWWKGTLARLTFILLRKEFQRKGYGTKFFKAWIEKFADKISDKYEIESPNYLSGKLLFKLGHLRMENDEIIEEKCIIIPSPGWSPMYLFNDF